MMAMKFTVLVTLAALFYTFWLSGKVGKARVASGIKPPATTGDEMLERAFRTHYNTIEQLVLFIPVLWLSTGVIGDRWTALIGLVWLVGRFIYCSAYVKDPSGRGPGMIITMGTTGVLMLISLWGVVRQFL